MCTSAFLAVSCVGGMWHDNTRCGLWSLTVNAASSNANGNVGARLLIKILGSDVCA